jgi:polyisoprenyl-phosphate glycosyltransferase
MKVGIKKINLHLHNQKNHAMDHVDLSIVVSVYNEDEVIGIFWKELSSEIKRNHDFFENHEVIFVNDGSTDKTGVLLDDISASGQNIRVLHFSRNFGHEAAMLAGIEHASGDAIICMDSDLQHPPSYLTEMFTMYKQGYEIVNMKRIDRGDGKFLMNLCSKSFYRILNRLSGSNFEPDASDFFLISGRVAKIIFEQYGERTRFFRGLIQNVGFKKTSIEYVSPRRPAGNSKYSITRLFFLSFSAIASFSHIPLRLGLGIGILFGLFSFIVGIYSIIMYFSGDTVSGYTTLVVLLSFGFSLLFIVIGIIGEYIGYIFTEVKKRPMFIIDRITEYSMRVKNDFPER